MPESVADILRASESNGNAIAQPTVRSSTSTPFVIGHVRPGPTVMTSRWTPGGSSVTMHAIDFSAKLSSTSSGLGSLKVAASRRSSSANAATPRPIESPAPLKSAFSSSTPASP